MILYCANDTDQTHYYISSGQASLLISPVMKLIILCF